MAKIMWIKGLLVFLSLSGLKLSAQEVLPEDSASSAGPLSFLEFVGWMERSEEIWITPFDLEFGFSIEEVAVSVPADQSGSLVIEPLESPAP